MNHTARLLPALLLTAAVSTVSVAGTATAAKMITGKDIKNGTITSIDVRNGSLARADLRAVSRTSIVAAPSPGGIVLPTCTDTALADCDALRTVAIQPGSQLVTATGTIDNFVAGQPALSNRCGLVQAGAVLTEARLTLAPNGDPGENTQFTLQQVVTVPDASAPVSLRCTEMAGEDLRLETAELTSVRTGY